MMRLNRRYIPVLLFCLLLAGTVLFSPRLREVAPEKPDEGSTRQDSLTQERHFDPYLADSVIALIQKIDPGGGLCQVKVAPEAITILKSKGATERRFNRIFFNKRTFENMAALRNLPVTLIRQGEEYGFRARLQEINGRKYIILPHGVMIGLVQESAGYR